jgi:hypothetical protein
MTEVTYFVALPFVAADDGIAAGEPTECFNPTAVTMRADLPRRSPSDWSSGRWLRGPLLPQKPWGRGPAREWREAENAPFDCSKNARRPGESCCAKESMRAKIQSR